MDGMYAVFGFVIWRKDLLCYILFGKCFFSHRNRTGITNSVKTVDVIMPPMMTQAMLTRVSEPSDRLRAVGSMPTTMVMAVMKIGFNRTLPASTTASRGEMPSWIRVRV